MMAGVDHKRRNPAEAGLEGPPQVSSRTTGVLARSAASGGGIPIVGDGPISPLFRCLA